MARGGWIDATGSKKTRRRVLVWDLPTRLFHWSVVGLVAAAYATWRLDWMGWHAWIGDALLTLVLWRLLWGICGSESARFVRFLAPPAAAVRHLAHLFRREPDRHAGHNPAGGWMVVVLLALLLVQTVSGIYVDNDVADVGPLTEMMPAPFDNAMTALHALAWDALLAAVALHVLAIAVYAAAKRHNLLGPMITGYKALPPDVPEPRPAGPARALSALAAAAAAAAALSIYL
ncbi:MAG TPA: cytochrome b/b6 domain-containing protein [Stellaceae bacterium]